MYKQDGVALSRDNNYNRMAIENGIETREEESVLRLKTDDPVNTKMFHRTLHLGNFVFIELFSVKFFKIVFYFLNSHIFSPYLDLI